MSFSLNQVQLIGNLGADAETKESLTFFSLATTESFKDKDGNWSKNTTWHSILAFNLSDYYKQALTKGSKFYISGRIDKKKYKDKAGIERVNYNIIANDLIPLGISGE